MRIHQRKDFDYLILKGIGRVSGRPAYACVITAATWSPAYHMIHHIRTFYLNEHSGDGHGQMLTARQVRDAARRYGGRVKRGQSYASAGIRDTYLPSTFGPLPAGLYFEADIPLD